MFLKRRCLFASAIFMLATNPFAIMSASAQEMLTLHKVAKLKIRFTRWGSTLAMPELYSPSFD